MQRIIFIILMIMVACSSKQQPKAVVKAAGAEEKTQQKTEYHTFETKTCKHTNLSKQFDITVDFKRYSDTVEMRDSCVLAVLISSKEGKQLDSIHAESNFLYSDMFLDCNNVRSYATKYQHDKDVVDNFFGDIVVADLNFDKLDDIAIVSDGGGNGGPVYSFLIQTADNKFVEDDFLTGKMEFFPHEIDTKKHHLVTYVHAGACCVGKHVYHLDENTHKWKQISHTTLGIP